MTDEERAKERLASLRKQIREELAAGIDRVNVHPKDELPSPAASERARAFHRRLGLPEDPKFLRDDE
jgi:hypothetical protein